MKKILLAGLLAFCFMGTQMISFLAEATSSNSASQSSSKKEKKGFSMNADEPLYRSENFKDTLTTEKDEKGEEGEKDKTASQNSSKKEKKGFSMNADEQIKFSSEGFDDTLSQ